MYIFFQTFCTEIICCFSNANKFVVLLSPFSFTKSKYFICFYFSYVFISIFIINFYLNNIFEYIFPQNLLDFLFCSSFFVEIYIYFC